MIVSVGANCVRPIGLQHTKTGEHSSPLQITIIKLADLKLQAAACRKNKKRLI